MGNKVHPSCRSYCLLAPESGEDRSDDMPCEPRCSADGDHETERQYCLDHGVRCDCAIGEANQLMILPTLTPTHFHP